MKVPTIFDVILMEATKKTKDKPMTKDDLLNNDVCPECKTPLDHAGSCVQCPNCGYSKCN